jgi:hypothetical protein
MPQTLKHEGNDLWEQEGPMRDISPEVCFFRERGGI